MEVILVIMKNQNVRNLVVVAVAAMLLATIAISMSNTTQNAFAYKKNQATSQANACGNDLLPTNVGCQNTGSQIQGDENSVALAAQQTFPAAVTPPTPPPTPGACEACFNDLLTDTDAYIAALNAKLAQVGIEVTITSIEQLCELLLAGTIPNLFGQVVSEVNPFLNAGVTVGDFVQCLHDAGV
jgi:hypothetical protein